jgi:acyl-coenzyme A thioesterase PaaI-like protein
MSVDFIRATGPGDFLVISAEFKAKGRDLIHLSAEAVNSKGKLAATAMSSLRVQTI